MHCVTYGIDNRSSYVGVTDLELTLHSIGRCIVIWMAVVHPITVSLVTATSWIRGIAMSVLFVVFPYLLRPSNSDAIQIRVALG
jgi:hypothetical protein